LGVYISDKKEEERERKKKEDKKGSYSWVSRVQVCSKYILSMVLNLVKIT
jgi:hypothetical protein